jgi:hypothetical protein
MKFEEQERWIDKTIAQKKRALENNRFQGGTRELIEGDIKALEAIRTTVNRHRAMRDAVVTVKANPQAAQFLRETS